MPTAIFDLDNTLADRSGSFARWAGELTAELGLDSSEQEWLTTADGDGFVPRPEFMAAVRQRYDLATPLATLLDEYQERIVAALLPDPRVPVELARLREAGWRVAIATNGSTRQQRAKIDRLGLGPVVDAVAISQEVGAAKPDRRLFEVAAQRCGVELTGADWMVGDCPTRDIAGGQRLGLRTVWMRRGRRWADDHPAPTAVADDVPAAVAALLAPQSPR